MTWERLPDPRREEISQLSRAFGEKPRFLVDENLGHELAAALKLVGYNTKSAEDAVLTGYPDESYWAIARREDRVLISKDRDFLDNRRFPLRLSPGVLILPDDHLESERFLTVLARAISLFKWTRGAYRGSKLDFTSPTDLAIESYIHNFGQVLRQRYQFDARDNAFIWTE